MNNGARYKLEVRINIVKEEWSGAFNADGTPKEDPNHGGYWRQTNERLEVNESLDLGALDFMGVMKVLGHLHETVKEIKTNDLP